MTLFPGRPAQVGPAHNAQSLILAYLPPFSPQQIALFRSASSRLRIQRGLCSGRSVPRLSGQSGHPPRLRRRVKAALWEPPPPQNAALSLFLPAAHNLIQHPAILRAQPSSIQQLRPVAPSLLQRAPPPPPANLLVVSAQQNFRHIPPAKRRRPRVM